MFGLKRFDESHLKGPFGYYTGCDLYFYRGNIPILLNQSQSYIFASCVNSEQSIALTPRILASNIFFEINSSSEIRTVFSIWT